MNEKIFLLNIILGPPTRFDEIIQDIKLRKFQLENILTLFQVVNYEFKIMIGTIRKKY